jgi:hypothetical protein
MRVKRSIEFDREERDDLLIKAAKAEAEKHLGKLADDEQFDVVLNSWNIEITVSKKPEPDVCEPVIDTRPPAMTPPDAPL